MAYHARVPLFTPGRDTALSRDAYLIDTASPARLYLLDAAQPAEAVMESVLDRVLLMAHSVYRVRDITFALFCGRREQALAFAATEPLPHGVGAALEDALAEHGGVTRARTETLQDTDLSPFLAFERGAVGFFESSFTRPFRKAAGRRGIRILGASLSHDPDPDVVAGSH